MTAIVDEFDDQEFFDPVLSVNQAMVPEYEDEEKWNDYDADYDSHDVVTDESA